MSSRGKCFEEQLSQLREYKGRSWGGGLLFGIKESEKASVIKWHLSRAWDMPPVSSRPLAPPWLLADSMHQPLWFP